MTPREKADQLYHDCAASIDYDTYVDDGVMFADMIASEVIEALSENQWQNKSQIEYWQEVKQEIRKI
jgi:hypothetical protein